MTESRRAFERHMKHQRIPLSEWWVYWPFWKAAVAWHRKNRNE